MSEVAFQDATARRLLTDDAYRSLVEFTVGQVHYAVPTACIRAVSLPTTPTVLPHLPAAVVGVIEHRSQVCPVLDLRIAFGVEERHRAARPKWMIIEAEGHKIAVVSDQVLGVVEVEAGGLRPASNLEADVDSHNLVGVVHSTRALIFVLEIASFREYTRNIALAQLAGD